MTTINEKLTRVDNNISNLKNILGISQDAEIEEIEKKINPEIGYIMKDYNESGYPTTLFINGITRLPQYLCECDTDKTTLLSYLSNIIV